MAASRPLTSGEYSLDFADLYVRLWELADDLGDGTRVYSSEREAAIKWVVAELAGTPAETGLTMRDNNELRQQAYARMVSEGWADRVHDRKWHLLVPPPGQGQHVDDEPERTDGGSGEGELVLVPVDDPDDQGAQVGDVPTHAVSDASGDLSLGGVDWSEWMPLSPAARVATRSPGVYLARVDAAIVYVGMAGVRRGQGVRGRLSVYARGRGAVSGLGEAVLDRALADPDWVAGRLEQLIEEGPARATEWAKAAFGRQPLDVAWTSTASREDAETLERRVLIELSDTDLWNRARPRPQTL